MVGRRSARTKSAGGGFAQAVLVTFLFFTVTIGAIGYLLYVTAERENAAAVAGERHLAQTAIDNLQDDMAGRLIDYAWWDVTAQQFDGIINLGWAEDSIGNYLQEQFGYSGTYGLSPEFETIYVSKADFGLPVDALDFLGATAKPFFEAIQDVQITAPRAAITVHQHEGAIYILAGSLVLYEELDVYPEALSPRPILIIFRELNSETLEVMANQFLLTNLHLSNSPAGEASILLTGVDQTMRWWLTWDPERPGDAILNDLFPKIAAVTVALAIAALLVFIMWARTVSSANEAKAQFLAKMSHELRTPLNPIIGFAEVIMSQLRGPVPEAYREYAADIHRSAKHLQGIIGDVLDFSKVESGELVLRETNLDIEDLILRLPAITSSTWDMNFSTGEQSRLPLRYEIEAGLPLVRADELRIRQVIINLLSNAAKFSNGSEVIIRAYRENNGLTIEVEDSGIGIEKKDIDRVFSPFVQAETPAGASKKTSGTGLGLSVSRELMRLHGGDLELKSVPGAGTTALITFPSDRLT